jgi:hypothetical protein
MPVITNIEDLRVLAEKRVPRMFYDYADSGSWTEGTYRANEADFQKIKLRQRVAVNMENRSTATKMVGLDVKMPVAIAPVGLTGMQSADGEIKAARAAEKFGIPFILSTMSICSMEDVAAHTTAPFMFQLYIGAHPRFASDWPTPQRPEKWSDCTTQPNDCQHHQPRHQTPLVLGHVGHSPPHLWQLGGPRQRREQYEVAVLLDERTV